jgi:integrase
MVRRRAVAAGIVAPIGDRTFRATGITNFLENGGTLEHAQDAAAHASPRTTRLYDRRKERITQAQVERDQAVTAVRACHQLAGFGRSAPPGHGVGAVSLDCHT